MRFISLTKTAKLGKELKKWYFQLRRDSEARTELRTLMLGILVCLTLYYGISVQFLDPHKKRLQDKTSRKQELAVTVTQDFSVSMSQSIQRLETERQILAEKITILELQEKLLHEQWDILSDAERFTRIVFTLLPSAPMSIEKNLSQMSLAASRTHGGFDLFPLSLAGNAYFADFFTYLQYVEKRPEVGMISNLAIEAAPVAGFAQRAKVRFSMVVGRLSLKEQR